MDIRLKPKKKYGLIRIGNSNDGGYLVEKKSYDDSVFLIGLGINDDWSFEKKFNKKFIGIDNQLCFKFLIKKFLNSFILIITNGNFFQPINYFIKIIEYSILKNSFIKATISNYDDSMMGLISLKYIFKNILNNPKKNSIFLKCDIEGSEYRILNDIIRYKEYITGLIIEFHDVDLHINKILEFSKEIKMNIVHIHANNFGGVDVNNDPLVIELTYSKNPDIIGMSPDIPNQLDKPNDKNNQELKLNFI